MSEKFKVGDEVVCIEAGRTLGRLVGGKKYRVSEIYGPGHDIVLCGMPFVWDRDRFELAADTASALETKDTNPKDAIASTKVALGLCSPIAKAFWAAAQFAGLTKYGAWNWRVSGVRASVYVNALERHIAGWLSGETHDPVDGTRHLGNIMACCAILLDAEFAGKLTDDRPPSVDIRAAYAEVEANQAALKEMYKAMTPVHMTIKDTGK